MLDAGVARRHRRLARCGGGFGRDLAARSVRFFFDRGAACDAYRNARRHIPADWSPASADDLHSLRQRVVDLRYQMDLIEPLWPRFGRMWTDEAERLRDRLGRCQDLEVLKRLTDPHQPLAHWRSRLTPACAERSAALAQRAARIAHRLFAETAEGIPHIGSKRCGKNGAAYELHRARDHVRPSRARAHPEINLLHLFIALELRGGAFQRDASGLQHIGIVGDVERQRDRLLGEQQRQPWRCSSPSVS